MTASTKWIGIFLDMVKYARITSKELQSGLDGKGSHFTLWESQRRFLEIVANAIEEGIHDITVLKGRQQGITTICFLIDVAWMALFPGTIGAFVTDTDGNREVGRATIKGYIASFPPGFFGSHFAIKKGADNRNFIGFTNGSRLEFLVAGTRKKATWGEGRAYSFIHLSERSKYGDEKGLKSFLKTFSQTNPNSLCISETTANGYNHFKYDWEEAGRDIYTKRRGFIGWWAKPGNSIKPSDKRFAVYGVGDLTHLEAERMRKVQEDYGYTVTREQLAWFRWAQSNETTTDEDLRQNEPWYAAEAFVQSGYSFFRPRELAKRLDELDADSPPFKGYVFRMFNSFFESVLEPISDPRRIREVELRIYEAPVKDAKYSIGVDPAFGRNDWKDRHGLQVLRCYADKVVQVAEYAADNIEAHQCAWVMAYLGGVYRDCVINVDLAGGPGKAVMHEFQALRAQLKLMVPTDLKDQDAWEDFLSMARWFLYHRADSMGGGYAYNFQTTRDLKWEGMSLFRDAVSTNQCEIVSRLCIEEMSTVVQDGGVIEAPGRNKDDRVFAMMLAVYGWKKWIQAGMMSLGETYEVVCARERGETQAANSVIAAIVHNYFKRARDEEAKPRVTYLMERGLE